MGIIAAGLLSITFLSIGLLHVYWVFGGKWALQGAMPEAMSNHVMADSKNASFKLGTMIVAIGLLAMSYLFLIKSGLLTSPVPSAYLDYGNYAVIIIFTLRAIGDFKYCGFFKRIKEGEFAKNDSKIYSPLCLAISILALAVLLG